MSRATRETLALLATASWAFEVIAEAAPELAPTALFGADEAKRLIAAAPARPRELALATLAIRRFDGEEQVSLTAWTAEQLSALAEEAVRFLADCNETRFWLLFETAKSLRDHFPETPTGYDFGATKLQKLRLTLRQVERQKGTRGKFPDELH